MDGGIFFDDNDQELLNPEGKKAALDITKKQKDKISKEKKEDILFPDDEEFNEILPKERKKRDKAERSEKVSRVKIELPQDLLDEYGDFLGDFDPSTASKKKFREFRKLLTRLSLIRYPKKQREKKSKKRNG